MTTTQNSSSWANRWPNIDEANWTSQIPDLLYMAILLLATYALTRLAFYMLRRIFVRSGKVGTLLLTFEKVFALLIWIGIALHITGWWPDLVQYLNELIIPIGRHKISASTILEGAVSVFITLVLALWVSAAMEERLMRIDHVHSSLRVVMARMGRAVLILLALLVSLSLVGIDLTVLSVFGGALGVGLGLGLQKIVSNYVSGFVILLERSLSLGDMVAVDKYAGKVTQINTRYTILQGLDGIESVIPNEMLISGPVQNYSLTNRATRLTTQVTVDYQTNIEELLNELANAVADVNRVLKNPAPDALLVKFGADGMELEIGIWIEDPENGRMGVLSNVNKAIWKLLQERQIRIPYSRREIKVLST